MSRCVLDNESRRTEVVTGWDRGIPSFFARVCDRTLVRAHMNAGVPEEEAGVPRTILPQSTLAYPRVRWRSRRC